MADTDPKSATTTINPGGSGGIPGSASSPHPRDAIPLPDHGFDRLDDGEVSGLATIPAAEVITEAAVLLMSAAAEKLGMSPEGEPQLDLVEARQLITALAGLIAASQDALDEEHRQPLRDGLTTLQNAFRAASSFPDAPGEGPGENLI
ncbi:MAG: hypothetical protein QOF87_2014 [Pseudonocardiales bacterium]|nr:hypothetical protein [Pseudonocardiales bacterium]MDT4958938.1 hypothetical protein [Pseudonocardiales bacterium]MDT4962367.1 hypothetical protein [Pseudonocardiales bacterium]MDT4973301.1 hypothetical protein [Pseudonocardiales bacterium]MDT4977961.1 hypothetical protein [Pseudonocardiales bacterium]